MNNLDHNLPSPLREDLLFLARHEVSHWREVTIDDVIDLLSRKVLYRSSADEEGYRRFKETMDRLQRAKLPFRIVKIIDDHWKHGTSLPHIIQEKMEIVLQRVKALPRKERNAILLQQLVKEALPHEKVLHIMERIHFLHGTNSALLPMIQKSLTLIPTGRLLDQGRAPMGGKIGGMGFAGVNQYCLSAETIRDLKRCWEYAAKVNHSFNPTNYEKEEALFLETLHTLGETSVGSDAWDPLIIRLLRLKQWHPDAFTTLCERHQRTIEECKRNANEQWLTPEERLIQRVIEEPMKRFPPKNMEEFISVDILVRFDLGSSPLTWKQAVERTDPLYTLLRVGFNGSILIYRHAEMKAAFRFFLVKWFTKELVEQLRREAEEETPLLRQGRIVESSYRYLEQIIRGETKRPLQEEDYPLIFEKLVGEKMKERIAMKIAPCQRRYHRLLRLLDCSDLLRFTQEEREMIEKPFPILLASTKAKPTNYMGLSQEFTFAQAQLGKEIDLAFVHREDRGKMDKWVKEHDLEERVTILDSRLLQEMETLPLYHADDDIKTPSFLLQTRDVGKLHHHLVEEVFPLYRQPYPDGSYRNHHGVVHIARTVLFASILMEMAHERKLPLHHDPIPLLLTMALHDVAREDDGEDLWDEKSGEWTKSLLMSRLKLSQEEAAFFGDCIANKEKVSTTLEQKIIHDGDCIEILRTLSHSAEFNFAKLRMRGEVEESSLEELILEAQLFIKITEEREVKFFLEAGSNSYALLLQILLKLYEEEGGFRTMVQYSYPFIAHLQEQGSYQLSPYIERRVRSSLQEFCPLG